MILKKIIHTSGIILKVVMQNYGTATNWEPGDTPIPGNNPDGFKIAIVIQSINIYDIIVNVECYKRILLMIFHYLKITLTRLIQSTVISYQLPVNGNVTLKVYDVLGNEIATLVNEEKQAGVYEVEFDGSALPSGIYFYQLQTVNPSTGSGQVFTEAKKMILLK